MDADPSVELFSDEDSIVSDSSFPDSFASQSSAEQIAPAEKSNEQHVVTQKEAKQLELALWASGQSVWSWDRQTNSIDLLFYSADNFRVVRDKLDFKQMLLSLHPDDSVSFSNDWKNHAEGLEPELKGNYRFFHDKDYKWYEVRGKISAFDDKGVQTIIGTFSDVSNRLEDETNYKLMSEAFEKVKQPMLVLTQNMIIAEFNEAWIQQIDTKEESIDNPSFVEMVPLTKLDMDKMKAIGFCEKTTELTIGDNPSIPVEIIINQFETPDTGANYYIVVLKDLTESIRTQKKLHKLATRHQVTGLINRVELTNQLEILLLKDNASFDLMYIDMVGMNEVRDAVGHENSERIMSNIARGFEKNLTDASIISHRGGNEFVIVFEHEQNTNGILDESYKQMLEITQLGQIERINLAIKTHSTLFNDQHFTINAYIGIAEYPKHAKTSSQLIRKADSALHYAKEAINENYAIYTKGMTDEIANRIQLVNDLREALDKEELSFVIQGKYNGKRELIGGELLCRWISEKHGFVSPGIFIPLIEKYGMEYQLGILALKQAIKHIQALGKVNVEVPISVNISASQALDSDFLTTLTSLISQTNVNAKLLEIEVTESVFINDSNNATDRLNSIRDLGVSISLDDFGTGYSSLSYLGQYQFDIVKIDRAFIIEIEQELKAKKLFFAIMNICQALDLDVVVEGIETESQFEILQTAGVDKFQGFLLGKPINIQNFIEENHLH